MTAPIALVGIDLGKHSFHVHAQDAVGHQLFRKQFTRRQLLLWLSNLPACTVAMEACSGAHWLAWKLREFGHQPRLIDPQRVRPFVVGNKHDFADAQAICEAACRPSIRSIEPKTPNQLALTSLHRLREQRVAERTACINQTHGFLLEFGISLPVGKASMGRLPTLAEDAESSLPAMTRRVLMQLYAHYTRLQEDIVDMDRQLKEAVNQDERAQRLLAIPGVGPVTASLICAEAGQAHQYRSARDFAASLGLVPRQHSTGGKANLLGISKRGDGNLRRLLVQGARAVLIHAANSEHALAQWAAQLQTRRHSNVVACALAAKLARIIWVVLVKNEPYRPQPRLLPA